MEPTPEAAAHATRPPRPRKKIIKYAFAGVGALALVVGGVAAYLVLTFDVRDHVPRLIELVKEKTGRTLRIDGEVKLGLWPTVGLRLGAVSLSERGSDEVFANVASARLAAKLGPLLNRQLVADELHLEGAHVRITRFANGHLNIDDLLSGEGGALDFDIARVQVTKSRVEYRDLAAGTRHDLARVELVTGRLTNAVPTPVTLSFNASDEAQRYALASTLQGRLTFDSTQRSYALDDATIKINGSAAGVSALAAVVKGSIAVRKQEGQIRARALTATVSGSAYARKLEARIELPALVLSAGNIAGEKMSVEAHASAPGSVIDAVLKAPRIEWRDGSVISPAATLDLAYASKGNKMHAALASSVTASVSARTINLTELQSRLFASGPRLPKDGVQGTLAGSASLDGNAEHVRAALAGTFAQSRVKATIGASGFASPAYTFDVDVDTLDLDRLRGTTSRPADNESASFDLADLSKLPAAGTLHIANLKSAGVTAKHVRMAFKPE